MTRRHRSGKYEVSSFGDEEARAFIPYPLPPKQPLDMGRLQSLLDKALVAIGALDSIAILLPDPRFYLSAFIRRESVLSSRIEGAVSTISDVFLFEQGGNYVKSIDDDLLEVVNYANALEYGTKRLLKDNFPLSNRLVKEIHAMLLRSGSGSQKAPGEFRRSQNWIGGTRPGNANYVPPPPQHVEQCMSDLEKFIHAKDRSISGLIKAGLIHAQFETIHPFLDGNGRVGRLLISLQLLHEGLLNQPMLYISVYINKHRDEYYRRLNDVRVSGNWESWLEYFLKAVVETAKDAVLTARQTSSQFIHDQEKIREAGGHRGSAFQVHSAFQVTPFQTTSSIGKFTGLTPPAVLNGVKFLEQLQIVKEITGKRRYRNYVYSDYLSILSDDPETGQT